MDEWRIAPGPVAKSPVQGWPAPGRFKLPGPPPASERRPTIRIKYPSNLNSGVEWAGAEKASGRRSGREQLRHRHRSPCLSMRTRVCYTTNPTPDEKNGCRTTGTSFWMDEWRIAPGPVAKSPVQGWPAPGALYATRRALPSPTPRAAAAGPDLLGNLRLKALKRRCARHRRRQR